MRLLTATAVLVLLFGSASVSAWSCATHQLICSQAGYPDLDCCAADKEATPAFYYHHCADNASDCFARVKAQEYLSTRPEISAHLIADSYAPVHWQSFGDCHSQFETKVNNYVKNNTGSWSVSMVCLTKQNQSVRIYADKAYLLMVADAVKNYLSGVATPAPSVQLSSSPQPPGGTTLSGLFESNKETILIFLAILLFLYMLFKRKRR